jgi:hypothetical protein
MLLCTVEGTHVYKIYMYRYYVNKVSVLRVTAHSLGTNSLAK